MPTECVLLRQTLRTLYECILCTTTPPTCISPPHFKDTISGKLATPPIDVSPHVSVADESDQRSLAKTRDHLLPWTANSDITEGQWWTFLCVKIKRVCVQCVCQAIERECFWLQWTWRRVDDTASTQKGEKSERVASAWCSSCYAATRPAEWSELGTPIPPKRGKAH